MSDRLAWLSINHKLENEGLKVHHLSYSYTRQPHLLESLKHIMK